MKKKQYAALARVSSREQEREGFSLEVQGEALHRFAEQQNGSVVKFFRIAETATKPQERRIFKGLLAYAREHASELDGVLFFKVDRAARNLFDYVELERLEVDCGLEIIYVTQPTENTPTGRMMRRTLANMASFITEQQSLDVKDGLAQRVANGLFPSRPPYGYRNVRIEGRSLPEVDPEHGPKVTRIYELYAYNSHTIDSLQQALCDEGIWYTSAQRRFPRSKLHQILRDRSYIGEIRYHGQWYPGLHQPLVSRSTFSRVQVLLGDKVYHNHELTYAGGLVQCSYCGRPISGELKTKKTRKGEKEYIYYRCARYNRSGHPRVRVTEKELDRQVLAIFDSIRIQDPKKRDWILRVLRERTRGEQATAQGRVSELRRQLTNVEQQQDRLLNLYLLEEIDSGTRARKSAELRDRAAELKLRLEAADRGRHEEADIAAKVFELSQSLRDKWVKADYVAKRRILEILCLNLTLVGATLVPEMRKPFAILAEGLNSTDSRGDSRCTFVNEINGLWLVLTLFPQLLCFPGDAVLKYVEPGLYSKRR